MTINVVAYSVSADGVVVRPTDATSTDGLNAFFSKVRKVDDYALQQAFCNCNYVGLLSFPRLVHIGKQALYKAFYNYNNPGITSVSFPKLASIDDNGLAYAFRDQKKIAGALAFPALTVVGQEALYDTFSSCTGLASVSFPSLMTIKTRGLYDAFYGCTGLTSVSFSVLTNINSSGLYYAFKGCTNLTEVHFPAALSGNSQCTASNMGCSNATIYFDL